MPFAWGGRYAIQQRQAVKDSSRTKGYFSSIKYTHVYVTASKNDILRGDRTAAATHIMEHPPRLTAVMTVKLKTSSVGTWTEGLQRSPPKKKYEALGYSPATERSTEQMELSDSISTVRFPFYSCCFAAAIFCRRNERSPLQVTLQLCAYRIFLGAGNS